MKVMRKVFIIVKLAFNIAFSESEIQNLAIVSKAVFFCGDDVTVRELRKIVC